MKSDKSATRSGLVGRFLTVLDLKTSWRTLSASMRWTRTNCRGSRVSQPMRNCHESQVNKCLFQHGVFSNKASFSFRRIGAILISLARPQAQTRLVAIKKSAYMGQADVPTNFNLIWPRQKICSSTTKRPVRLPLPTSVLRYSVIHFGHLLTIKLFNVSSWMGKDRSK